MHLHRENKNKNKDLYIDTEPAPQIMSTPPTPTSKSRRECRNTGFPEPFCGSYNTTLPHPDADLSPNAILTGDSLSPEGSMRRRRLSMLHKHRRTVSQSSSNSSNSITTPSKTLYSVLGAIQSQIPGASQPLRPGSSNHDSIDEEADGHAREEEERPVSRDTLTPSPQSKGGLFRSWRMGRN